MTDYCADCGKPVEWWPPRNRWASKETSDGHIDVYVFTCRTTRHGNVLVAADYHHIPGEPQQHYRPTTGYTSSLWPDAT